jgi:hypothetical protein
VPVEQVTCLVVVVRVYACGSCGNFCSDRFSRMVLETESVRKRFLPGLFPILYGNSVSHWHEYVMRSPCCRLVIPRCVYIMPEDLLCVFLHRSVRTLSTHVLQLYLEVDSELYATCAQAWEASRGSNAKITAGMGSPTKGVAVPQGKVPAKA